MSGNYQDSVKVTDRPPQANDCPYFSPEGCPKAEGGGAEVRWSPVLSVTPWLTERYHEPLQHGMNGGRGYADTAGDGYVVVRPVDLGW